MKLGVFSPVLGEYSLVDALKYLKAKDVDFLELGCGGFPGTAHCDAKRLLGSKSELSEFKKVLADSSVKISALSCHGNMLHPDESVAASFQKDFDACLALAGEIGIDRVVTFSGCPGDGKGDMPNWVTCPWPPEFTRVLAYQWNDKLIPYWRAQSDKATSLGVKRIALEMHPGFCVYNAETLLRLRAAAGSVIGANLDPSHLVWQGANIVDVISALGEAIYFFHAKDTALNRAKIAVNGVLDNTSYVDIKNRSWSFRTVGYGMGQDEWKSILSALRVAGYDDVISIEHEDGLMCQKEGLEKAIAFLQNIIIKAPAGEMYWS